MVVYSINMFGALRDLLDPRLRRSVGIDVFATGVPG